MLFKKAIPFFSNESSYLKQVIQECTDECPGVFVFAFFREIVSQTNAICQGLITEKIKLEFRMFQAIVLAGVNSKSFEINKMAVEILMTIADKAKNQQIKLDLIFNFDDDTQHTPRTTKKPYFIQVS